MTAYRMARFFRIIYNCTYLSGSCCNYNAVHKIRIQSWLLYFQRPSGPKDWAVYVTEQVVC